MTRVRRLHPVAWWVWAIGMATAASRVTNPWLLLMILAVTGYVVTARRGSEPWSNAYRVFLTIGFIAIGVRLVFHILLGGVEGDTILIDLPSITLPEWTQGIRLGGAVTLEGVLYAVYDGLRLATLLGCVGAANALASPRRLVRSMPAALYEVSVAVVVALTVAPQLVTSTRRVHRARRLRGDTSKRPSHILRRVVAPVLHDALDRSLRLAAAMDCRGYGRKSDIPTTTRRATATMLLLGLLGLCVGAFGLLGAQTPTPVAAVLLASGAILAGGGILLASRRVPRTRFRPDPFGAREWTVAASGIVALAAIIATELLTPGGLTAETHPPQVPVLPVLAGVGILVGLVPSWAAPAPGQPPGPPTSSPLSTVEGATRQVSRS